MNNITPLGALKDNYIWAVHSPEGAEIIIVDPGDSMPVLDYIEKNKLNLKAILLTHHHYDHTGGVTGLLNHFPDIAVYGPLMEKEKVAGITHPVKEGDEFYFSTFNLRFQVLEIPGHTAGHIAFFSPNILFCGDTLFSCGCGRLFEGTPAQMVTSLEKIKGLPKETLIFCAHEYTAANIVFALEVEPDNALLKARGIQVNELRQRELPTLPTSLASELQCNPFLRIEEPSVKASVEKYCGFQVSDPIEIFAHLRQWKNQF